MDPLATNGSVNGNYQPSLAVVVGGGGVDLEGGLSRWLMTTMTQTIEEAQGGGGQTVDYDETVW
jgi:hypothetical protein